MKKNNMEIYIFKGGRGAGKSAYFELTKNLAHLQILIKQHHSEVDALELDISGDCPAVLIHYDRSKNEFSKVFFDFKDDPLNLYRRILDDIIDTAFVMKNRDFSSIYPPLPKYRDTEGVYYQK